jgi:HPt (histidine-containing phosphotransfer) domain-containing protein
MVKKWVYSNTEPAGEVRSTSGKEPQMQENSPMNYEEALEEFEDDEAFLMEVLEGFLNNAKNQITKIRQGISDDNPDIVKKEAHAIKGGAANLTAMNLSEVAYELETIGASGDLGEKSTIVLDNLEQELSRLEAFAKAQ